MHQNSYLPKTVQEWNLLTENVKQSPFIQILKNYLKMIQKFQFTITMEEGKLKFYMPDYD